MYRIFIHFHRGFLNQKLCRQLDFPLLMRVIVYDIDILLTRWHSTAIGLHAVICGAGSPLPDEGRTGPCTMVIAGDRKFIVDTGTNSARRLARMGFRLTEVRWYIFRSFDSFCTEYPTSQRHTELCRF